MTNTSQAAGVSDRPFGEGKGSALVLIALWLVGVVIGLSAFAKSQLRAQGLVRRAIPVTSRRALELSEQLRELADIQRRIPVLVSSEVTVPLAFGCIRPVIVLPSGYGQWTTDKRRAVLSHEFAHIRRKDVLCQQIAQLASVLYWCQPLVWIANWRMRVEREFACDDEVLEMGESPQEYARHLLDVATMLVGHAQPPKCVVAIASRCGLERRIKAILQPSLNRRPVGRCAGRMLACAVFAIAIVFCLLSPSESKNVELGRKGGAVAARSQPKALIGQPKDVTRQGSLLGVRVDDNSAVAEGQDEQQVILRFPAERAIGVIYIQDHDNDIRQEPLRWADARGEVAVPIGKTIRLDISAAGRDDLAPLRQLAPGSLDMLLVREADLDETALKSISHLTGLSSILLHNCRIPDAGFRHLAKLSDLEVLDLSGSLIEDPGLAHLESLQSLTELNLGYISSITDRGMQHVARLRSLVSLNLEATRVTDAGLASIIDLTSLRSLNLGEMGFISGAGLAHLANLTELRDLDIRYTRQARQPFGDEGVAHLGNLRQLRRLVLSGAGLTDAGLVYLRSLSNLEELWLPSGPSDSGLEEIRTLISLRKLGVSTSMASDRGIGQLCHLENLEYLNLWCGGSRVTDRAAAHLRRLKGLKTLRLLGSAMTDDGLRSLTPLKSLEELRLHGNGITFEGLRHLQEFPSLNSLSFSGLKGSHGTLRHLRPLSQLKVLRIGKSPQLGVDGVGTATNDEGLAYLSSLRDLEHLSLSSIPVTNEGIRHISGFKLLKTLDIASGRNSFTDAGLQALADLKKLEVLFIRGAISDRGLVHLAGLESLHTSHVQGRSRDTISEAAMEELSESLPSMKKVYNLRKHSPKAKQLRKRAAAATTFLDRLKALPSA